MTGERGWVCGGVVPSSQPLDACGVPLGVCPVVQGCGGGSEGGEGIIRIRIRIRRV